MLTKEQILGAVERRAKVHTSSVFGGDVRYQELSRAEWRAASRAAETGERTPDGAALINIDQWNARVFAAGVVGEDGAALFAADTVLNFPKRDDLWEEIAAIATLILDLSEVGSDALKAPSSDLPEKKD